MDLAEHADRIARVDGVVGVVLGGSRARGTATASSDTDLGLYYRGRPDVAALTRLAAEVSDSPPDVSAPGGWGPWVDGGSWLTVEGEAVDWIFRDLARVEELWDAAQSGRCGWHHQVGHPLGFLDVSYPGELALGQVLADPSGELRALQQRTRQYPAALGRAMVDGLWETDLLLVGARKTAGRGDLAVVGYLFRCVLLCAHALHGHAGRWLVTEKGAVAAAAGLPGAPDDVADLARQALATGDGSREALEAAVTATTLLVRRTRLATAGAPAGRPGQDGDDPRPPRRSEPT